MSTKKKGLERVGMLTSHRSRMMSRLLTDGEEADLEKVVEGIEQL